jgi:hypothetical protein
VSKTKLTWENYKGAWYLNHPDCCVGSIDRVRDKGWIFLNYCTPEPTWSKTFKTLAAAKAALMKEVSK